MIRGLGLFLAMCCGLLAAEHKSVAISVSVKPEVVLSMEGGSSVRVKIRLSPSASAQLWIADSCTADGRAVHVVPQSGEYHIPISELSGNGSMACLISMLDGLSAEVPVSPKPGLPTTQISSEVRTISSI